MKIEERDKCIWSALASFDERADFFIFIQKICFSWAQIIFSTDVTYASESNQMEGVCVVTFPIAIDTHYVMNGAKRIVYYPQVKNMQNPDLQQFINETIVSETQRLIDKQTESAPTWIEEMLGSYELKNNQRNVLSLSLSNYAYFYHAAHGMTYISSLTFDIERGKRCRLADLFQPGSDYVERISALVRAQIKQRNIQTLHEFTSIRNDQDFYLADKTLVIYFQLYEITPYVFGFPMFPISVYELTDIIAPDGPLARLASN